MRRFPSDQQNLRRLADEPHDLLVIGGGIVGAGVARDAALRGLKAALVEKHDFAYGTSSRSSRLLHGGIRYLAQGRVRLVREASVEKAILGRIAPHLAEPRAFLFPVYHETPWPLWQLKVGVKIYDLLCGGQNFGKSHGLSRAEALAAAPGLNPQGLKGGVRYFDGFTQDARLVLDTLRSAAQAQALLANYTRFDRVRRDGDSFIVEVTDLLTDSPIIVRTRAVVNATGAWAQGLGLSSVRLRPTKGIHLVFDRQKLPVPEALAVTERTRLLFVLPWGARVIVGTTDTDFSGIPESVRTETADVRYVLETVNRYFPQANLTTTDVLSTWAGLRPLIADPKGNPSDISRSHQIAEPQPGWWDVAGGKLTTYRLMAEQTVDQVAIRLNRTLRKCETADRPLLTPEETKNNSGIIPPPFSKELIEHYCRHEWALSLQDVMLRRSSWAYFNPDDDGLPALAASEMSRVLGWNDTERERQLASYHKERQLEMPR